MKNNQLFDAKHVFIMSFGDNKVTKQVLNYVLKTHDLRYGWLSFFAF